MRVRPSGAALALAVAAALVSCGSDETRAAPEASSAPAEVTAPQAAQMPSDDAERWATTDLNPAPVGAPSEPMEASDPVRVAVVSVGIDALVIDLGLDPTGAVAAPTDFDTAGWYTGSAQPGQPGPAVLAGHVDSTDGPAAFYRLRDVAIGEEVIVHREDGSIVTFRVAKVEQYPKDVVPADALYGPTPGAELRLITCGGDFDRAARSYEDNIVVYATL